MEHLARDWGSLRKKKGFTYAAAPVGFSPADLKVGFLDCFMNESGPALKRVIEAEGVPPEKTLIVVDDFMIPLGTLRLRTKGSSGGHNGLNSIIATLGHDQFPRLRLGIGPVDPGMDPADFVLKKFSRDQYEKIKLIFGWLEDKGIKALLEEGAGKAMNAINAFDLSAQSL